MLGVCLLFVGIVLINNGMCALYKVDGKSAAVMNILTGTLSLFINFVNLLSPGNRPPLFVPASPGFSRAAAGCPAAARLSVSAALSEQAVELGQRQLFRRL